LEIPHVNRDAISCRCGATLLGLRLLETGKKLEELSPAELEALLEPPEKEIH
jgi:hypothetical protein